MCGSLRNRRHFIAIAKLPERGEKVRENNGEYFEITCPNFSQ